MHHTSSETMQRQGKCSSHTSCVGHDSASWNRAIHVLRIRSDIVDDCSHEQLLSMTTKHLPHLHRVRTVPADDVQSISIPHLPIMTEGACGDMTVIRNARFGYGFSSLGWVSKSYSLRVLDAVRLIIMHNRHD